MKESKGDERRGMGMKGEERRRKERNGDDRRGMGMKGEERRERESRKEE